MRNMKRRGELVLPESLLALLRKTFGEALRRRFALILAGIVVFTTTYALILPALTLENDTASQMEGFSFGTETENARLLNCEVPIHEHEKSCYRTVDGEKTLVCGQADYVLHQHNAACYDDEGTLVCELPEKDGEEHIHSMECYEQGPDGETAEDMGWVTVDEDGNLTGDPEYLICGELEVREHQHTHACFTKVEQEDTPEDESDVKDADRKEKTSAAEEPKAGSSSKTEEKAGVKTDGTSIGKKEEDTAKTKDADQDQAENEEESIGDSDVPKAAPAETSSSSAKPSGASGSRTDTAKTKQTKRGDGLLLTCEGKDYTVRVSAENKEVLPEDTRLQVSEISCGTPEYCFYRSYAEVKLNSAESRVLGQRFFDISFLTDGEKVEPEGSVDVEITFAEAQDTQNPDGLSVIHFLENGETEMPENDATITDDGIESIRFTSDSFSVYGVVYTVDFAYEKDGDVYEYSLPGGEKIALSELAEALGIYRGTKNEGNGAEKQAFDSAEAFVKEVADVAFSDESLVKVTKTSGDWELKSLKAFDTEETLTITMKNGDVVTVKVTDAKGDGSGGSSGGVSIDPGSASYTKYNDLQTWQIVNQGGTNAYNYVRVHKKITANDAENGFQVKLWIDLKQQSLVQQILSNAGYAYTTNKHDVGAIVPSSQGYHSHLSAAADLYNTNNADFFCKTPMPANSVRNKVPQKDHNVPYTVIIKNKDTGEQYVVNLYGWQSQFSNGQLYIRTSNGGTPTGGEGNSPTNTEDDIWICIGDLSKHVGNTTTELIAEMTSDQIETMVQNAIKSNIGKVTDVMGDNISLDEGSIKADGSVSVSENTISWDPVILTRAAKGTGDDEGWYVNVAEMTYNVTLTPPKSTGLTKKGELPGKKIEEDVSAKVNARATYTYTIVSNDNEIDARATFPEPYVRGMLYDVQLKKVDSQDASKTLDGAQFTLYSDKNCTKKISTSSETGKDGTISFAGLLCGTYYVKETKAPDNYNIDSEGSIMVTLGYFDADQGDRVPGTLSYTPQGVGEDLLYEDDSRLVFKDTPKGASVILKKIGINNTDDSDEGTPLAGATFTVYVAGDDGELQTDANGTIRNEKANGQSSSNGSEKTLEGLTSVAETGLLFEGKLTEGIYFLHEDTTPAGYYSPVEDVKIQVEGSTVIILAPEGDSKPVLEESKSDEGTTYTIKLKNIAGAELPATGGIGTHLFYFFGVLLATLSGAALMIRRRTA